MWMIIVLVIGIVVGTIFHAVISKWGKKAKDIGQELAHDIQEEAKKATNKNVSK